MASETIDIVVREDGSRTVQRSLEAIGDSSERSAKSLEALQAEMLRTASGSAKLKAELDKSRSAQVALQSQVDKLKAQFDSARASTESAAASQKMLNAQSGALQSGLEKTGIVTGKTAKTQGTFEDSLRGVRREIVQGNRTVDFFANALNGLVPASSVAGEGLRLLAGGLIGGAGVGLAIEAVMAGLRLLGTHLRKQVDEMTRGIDIARKQRDVFIDLDASVKSTVDSYQSMGKGQDWLSGKLTEFSSNVIKATEDLDALKKKLNLLSGGVTMNAIGQFERPGWLVKTFFGDDAKKIEQDIKAVTANLDTAYRAQVEAAIDYRAQVLPALSLSEDKALRRSVQASVTAIDAEAAKSKSTKWIEEQTLSITDRVEALRAKYVELDSAKRIAMLTEPPGTVGREASIIALRQLAIQDEIDLLKARATQLPVVAAPIAFAQGEATAKEWERTEGETTRRIRRDTVLASANEVEAINIRLGADLEEIQKRSNKTLEGLTGAGQTAINRIHATTSREILARTRQSAAEQARLVATGGIARDVRAEARRPSEEGIAKLIDAENKLNQAVAAGQITWEQKVVLLSQLDAKYKDQINPLGAVNDGLQREVDILGMSSKAREIVIRQLAIEKDLRSKGVTVTTDDRTELTRLLTTIEAAKQISQARDALRTSISGKETESNAGIVAAAQAYKDLEISATQANYRIMEMRNLAGKGDFSSGFVQQLGVMDAGVKNFSQRAGASFGTFTNSVTQGFSQVMAQNIVMGESFEEGMRQMAASVVTNLIASLIQVGVQIALNAAVGAALGSAAVATGTAEAAALATAWAVPAALASLATLGANALPATGAVIGTVAIAKTTAVIGGGFSEGGYTGDIPITAPAGIVHGQEFVSNARATRANRPLLEALNRGVSPGSTGTGSGAAGVQLNVKVENYSGAAIEVQRLSPTEVRVIARDEARRAVASETPRVVAAELGDANSRTSKALGQNTRTARRRT